MNITETELINRIVPLFSQGDTVLTGPGDDCAVVKHDPQSETDLLLTSDPCIESVHFEPGTDPALIGHKALSRALSDIAAMGGSPLWALVNLAAPPAIETETIEAVFEGLRRTADKCGISIAGGDIAKGPVLELNIFAAGSVPTGNAVLRSTAKPGDAIYVTGPLGGSIKGKHLSFEPRLEEGLFLREWASAMIDITDGVAADLGHIIDMSGTGAIIDEACIPIADAARSMNDDISPLEHALSDGEDFELLYTVPPGLMAGFETAWTSFAEDPPIRIGEITEKKKCIEMSDKDGNLHELKLRGFDHFEQ